MSTRERTVLRVEGMTCGSCVRHVQEALEQLPGVAEVQVSLSESQAVVEHQLGLPERPALIEAVREAGYECSVRSDASESR